MITKTIDFLSLEAIAPIESKEYFILTRTEKYTIGLFKNKKWFLYGEHISTNDYEVKAIGIIKT